MKKVFKRWKVFLIVICMLITMMPAAVFADDSVNQISETQVQEIPQSEQPVEPGAQPGQENQQGPETPAGEGTTTDGITSDDPEEPAGEGTTTGGITSDDPEEPADPGTLPESGDPAVTDVTPTDEAVRMMTMTAPCSPGEIEITKVIVNDPGTNDTFKFKVYKLKNEKWNFVTDKTINGAGTVTVYNLVPGDYKVEEVDIPDYYVADDTETDKFNVGAGSVVPVTFTNSYTRGTITIEKNVENTVPGQQDTFTFEIYQKIKMDCHENWNLIKTVSIEGPGTLKVDDLSIGEYKVKEVSIPSNYSIVGSISERSAEIAKENKYTDKVSFTNKYTAGTITINKEVVGNPGSAATFTFEIFRWNIFKCKWDPAGTTEISGSGSVLVKDLSDGAYRIVEGDADNYTAEQTEFIIKLCPGDRNPQVTFRNTYNGPTTGSIIITKHVESDEGVTVPATDFTFHVTGPGYDKIVTLDNSERQTTTIQNLPPGAYTITEDEKTNFVPKEGYTTQGAVAAGGTWNAEFTNVYHDPGNPQVWVEKDVALYDGEGIPESGFGKSLTLTELNKSVIYRIRIGGGEVQTLAASSINLSDNYDRKGTVSDITTELKSWNGEEFVTPDGFYPDDTYYYTDTLTENGTYTNTVTQLGSELEKIVSSSAVVVVNYSSGGDSGDSGGSSGGGSHHHDYQSFHVTYNSNFPAITGISGSVPVDSNNYSYNNTVNVKGNTGYMKAENYIFKGWNTKPDGTGTMYQNGSIFYITEDITLYAIWEAASSETLQQTQTDTQPQPAEATSEPSNGLDNVPKTGDSTPLLLMLLLSIMSITSIELFGRRKVFKVNTDK